MKCQVVVFSYHHKNTEKIANAMAEILDTSVQTPSQVSASDLAEAELIGLGSGVYDAKHHPSILQLADELPLTANGKAFIFSTTGAPKFAITNRFIAANHSKLRERLQPRGMRLLANSAVLDLTRTCS